MDEMESSDSKGQYTELEKVSSTTACIAVMCDLGRSLDSRPFWVGVLARGHLELQGGKQPLVSSVLKKAGLRIFL